MKSVVLQQERKRERKDAKSGWSGGRQRKGEQRRAAIQKKRCKAPGLGPSTSSSIISLKKGLEAKRATAHLVGRGMEQGSIMSLTRSITEATTARKRIWLGEGWRGLSQTIARYKSEGLRSRGDQGGGQENKRKGERAKIEQRSTPKIRPKTHGRGTYVHVQKENNRRRKGVS